MSDSDPSLSSPTLTRFLLRLCLPANARGRTIWGDLEEEFRDLAASTSAETARRWYRRQAFGVLTRYVVTRPFRTRTGARFPNSRHRSSFLLPGTVGQDLRYGARALRRNPAFTAVAVLTLAIGIGASTAVFSVVDAVLVRPLPYEEPDRVVMLYTRMPPGMGGRVYITPANFFEYQERSRSFTGMAYLERGNANLNGGAEPLHVYHHRVSANFFEVLGVSPGFGRMFLPGDDDPGNGPLVVLSHSLWQRAFRGDPGVIGSTILLDEVPHSVVGVAPPQFSFNSLFTGGTPDLWVTAPVSPELRADRTDSAHPLLSVARLRDGVTLQQAQAEMNAIAAALAEEYPRSNQISGKGLGALVTGMHRDAVRMARPFLLVSMTMAGLVLLIACINVANLLLARAATRRREIAVRTSLGAGRSRIVRQLLTESGMLAVLGGAGGLLLARFGVNWLVAWGPHPQSGIYLGSSIPLLSRADIDVRALIATVLICVIATAAFGLVPALLATRSDPLQGLRSGESSTGWHRRFFDRNVFVAVEVALALLLLIGTGLLTSTFVRLYHFPLGFRPDRTEAMSVELTRARYMTESGAAGGARAAWTVRPALAELTRNMVRRIESHPGVDAVGAIDILPLRSPPSNHGGGVHIDGAETSQYEIAGIPFTQDETGKPHTAMWRVVTPGYFDAMSIPLLTGRDFSWSDDASAPGVVILDQDLAAWFWPHEGALGKRLHARVGREWRYLEVVGVVGAVWQHGFYPDAMDMESQLPGRMYFPYTQPASEYRPYDVKFLTTANVVVRHRGDRGAIAAVMRETLRTFDPDAPITRLESMEASLARSLADRRFHLLVIGSFSVVALALALIGIYGVMAFQVGQRVHEIGVRMALGARASGVVRMVVGEGSRVAVLGVLLGVAGAMGATRLLSTWLYGITPTDPVVFASLAGVMVAVAVLACLIPARRAARVDPINSLRAE